MKQIRLISTAVIALLVLGACGYQLIGGKGIYGGDISSIYVSVFQNLTYEPHISQPVTESFSRELVSTGLFTLNEQSADGYLKGEITDVKTAASSLDATGVVIEKSVTVTVRIVLYEKNGKLVKGFGLSDSEIYRVEFAGAEEYNRREAIRRLSARMARRFSSQLLLEY